jgi:hypothetical protein
MFIDLAIAYALLNFIGTFAIGNTSNVIEGRCRLVVQIVIADYTYSEACSFYW